MVKPNRPRSLREQFNISRFAIRYSWLTVSFWLAVSVAGILALSSLKYALFPDVTFPVVAINASAPLQRAVDTEQKLTKPLEQQLKTLPGLDGINSTTYPGRAVVRLYFAVVTKLENSTKQVKAAIDRLQLPEKSTTQVLPINLNEAAVVSYAVESNDRNLEVLTKTTKEQIIPALAKLPGILKVNLLGEPVKIDLTKPPSATQGLTQGGTIVRFDGRPALAFQAVKQGDANALEVARSVDKAVKELQTKLPNVKFTLAATQVNYIRAATRETIYALLEAIVLSIVVIYPFLWNWRATIISALAIPMSLLGAFIVMAIFGFNLETITLLALAMAIGNIVDDAIVDVENISRHLEKGETPQQAAILATNEIGLTVTAATLTAVAVFLPVGMMGGVLGQFFKPFGITISAAMLASLLVARTLSPLLGAYWLKPVTQPQSEDTPSKPLRRYQNLWSQIEGSYRNLLARSLQHRRIVVAIAVLSFVVGIALIPLIPKGFIPKLDRGEFNITYTAPLSVPQTGGANLSQNPPKIPTSPLEDSLKVARQLDGFVRQSPQVEKVFTIVGSRQGEPNKGTIYVKLKRDRAVSTAQLQDRFRQQLPQIPGVATSVEDIQFVDTGGEKPVQIGIVGEDVQALDRTAQKIAAKLEKIPGFEDVTTTAGNNRGNEIFQIDRSEGRRVAGVSANLGQDLPLGKATDRAVAEAKAVLPPGITLDLGGDSARVNEILSSFGTTLALSVLCIILVLFLLFRNWTDTVVIFLSLPLSIVGAMLGLLVAQSDFGMVSLIGIIFLLGLSNKNAILIVDYIKQLRRSGMSRQDAVLEAGPVRLRPILMTTAATILGMLPLALGLGAGAELRAPMAIAIMGGLVTSTLLSLIVVPVIYTLLDDLQSLMFKR